ncbi:MAG: hypothetical protein AB1634_14020 [Thermodesulfobacteriota bacterium]
MPRLLGQPHPFPLSRGPFLAAAGAVAVCLLLLPLFLPADGHGGVSRASAVTTAILDFEPQIAVQTLTPTVFMRQSGAGDIEGNLEFEVEANTSSVSMMVEATGLHFSRDLEGREVAPIPLRREAGVGIEAPEASLGGGRVSFEGPGDPIDSLPSDKTEAMLFQGRTPYRFSSRVLVTVLWDQDEPVKPAGQYVGRVKLTCIVDPTLP